MGCFTAKSVVDCGMMPSLRSKKMYSNFGNVLCMRSSLLIMLFTSSISLLIFLLFVLKITEKGLLK